MGNEKEIKAVVFISEDMLSLCCTDNQYSNFNGLTQEKPFLSFLICTMSSEYDGRGCFNHWPASYTPEPPPSLLQQGTKVQEGLTCIIKCFSLEMTLVNECLIAEVIPFTAHWFSICLEG